MTNFRIFRMLKGEIANSKNKEYACPRFDFHRKQKFKNLIRINNMIIFIKAVLCRYAFPACAMKGGVASGLPLCHEDCIALK